MVDAYVYIISDGTGETASALVKAAVVHYAQKDIQIIRCKNVRTDLQVERVIDEIRERKGIIAYTVVSNPLKKKIQQLSSEAGLIAIDLLSPLFHGFDSFFGTVSDENKEAGLLRMVDDTYFKRISAIEYTVKHDDGKDLRDLDEADIILVGISRTSKTPLSVFLSHKGWKVANIPLVLNVPLPKELFTVDQRKIVGLLIDRQKLSRIRRNRLEKFQQDPGGDYASLQNIHSEIEYATEIFKQNKRWPVFDVTERALEETATEIVKIVSRRMGIKGETIF
ncbi:MAG: kinase/pyrophosphorylase [Bdellovibrionales bacterium]|nr:kinase/pyrophosphorylase [Bdellovibrionales bacterium]